MDKCRKTKYVKKKKMTDINVHCARKIVYMKNWREYEIQTVRCSVVSKINTIYNIKNINFKVKKNI